MITNDSHSGFGSGRRTIGGKKRKGKKQVSVQRTVRLPEPSEEMRPWTSDIVRETKIFDRVYPYPENGFITPEGWFFQCDPCGHDRWAKVTLGVLSTFLVDQCGWVLVWNFVSMFSKAKMPDFRFRWNTDKKLTVEQKATMIRCCESWKLTTAQALKGFLPAFERED